MSIGAAVQHVSEVLEHARALFDGGVDAPTGVAHIRGVAHRWSAAQHAMTAFSGQFAAEYGRRATDAGKSLDELAGADDQLVAHARTAAEATRTGGHAAGRVMGGAAVDTARLAPLTGTPAGQRALLTALRDRVIEQQRVVTAYQARDARMATLMRGLIYQRRAGIGGGGLAGLGIGGGGLPGGGALGSTSPISAAAGSRVGGRSSGAHAAPHVVEAADWRVPAGPGGQAAAAALGKRGRPYVWGAKGPNVFDCSGLTQWAWRQAGVQLGGDTYAQITDGVAIPPDQVRAGDLIFPKSAFGEGGQPGPGHVMLAISPTEVVHAPHTGDVVRVAPMPPAFVARRPVPLTVR